jgi:Tryptophan-associated transmembrane protein (Trp_oprn_chp)
MLSTERPSALRLAGFVCTALGGALIALGALLGWASTSLGPNITGVETKGVDTFEGKVVLALGVAILVAIPALRLAGSGAVRRAIAIGVIAASLVAGALALWDVAAAEDRLGPPAAADEAAIIARQSHLPEDVLRTELAKLAFVSIRPGIYVPIAGAVLGVVGGALSLAWARREDGAASERSARGPDERRADPDEPSGADPGEAAPGDPDEPEPSDPAGPSPAYPAPPPPD